MAEPGPKPLNALDPDIPFREVVPSDDYKNDFDRALGVQPAIYWGLDWEGPNGMARLHYVSRSVKRILGYPTPVWGQDPFFFMSVVHPEDRDRFYKAVSKDAVPYASPVHLLRCIASDGRIVWLEARWVTVSDDAGNLIGLQGVSIDVSDRRRVEDALRESETRYRRITETTAEGIVAIDSQGHVIYINRSVTEMLGYTIEDIEGPQGAEVMNLFREQIDAIRSYPAEWAGRRFHEVLLRHRDGSEVWASVAVSPDYDEAGRFDSALCFLTDITERKITGEALQSSERRYQLLAENATDMIMRFDRDLFCLYANPAVETLMGAPAATVIGKTMAAFDISAEEVAFWHRQVNRAMDSGLEHTLVHEHDGPQGRRHLQSVLVPEFSSNGVVATCLVVSRDLTERHRQDEQQRILAEANTVLSRSLEYDVTIQSMTRLVVPRLADGCLVFIHGEDGTDRIVAAAHVDPRREALLRRLKLPQTTAQAMAPASIGSDLSAVSAPALDTWVPADDQEDEQNRLLRSLGVRSSMAVPLAARGRAIGTMVLLSAESGRRFHRVDLDFAEDLAGRSAMAMDNARLYQEVRQMNQAKDEFLALLSHELRNPLASLWNALHATGLDEDPERAFEGVIDELKREVRSMSHLVEDLLDVSRINRGQILLRPEPRDLETTIRSAAESSRQLISDRGHTLQIHSPDAPLVVHADPLRLEQVVRNLLNNAAKYTPTGGLIEVEAERDEGMAILRVRDNGVGIAPDTISLLFRPFYQVAPQRGAVGDGLGLGLSLVRSLAQMHGGSVTARSEGVGKGSEFIVRWPLAEVFGPVPTSDGTGPRDRGPVSGRAAAAPECRRVLLVEDNIFSGRMLARILTEAGYEVRTAFDGPSALDAVEEESPDTLLLDIALPGLDGYEVARRLRSSPRHDGMVIVALTGYGREEDRDTAFSSGIDHHLTKPVNFAALLELLANHERRKA